MTSGILIGLLLSMHAMVIDERQAVSELLGSLALDAQQSLAFSETRESTLLAEPLTLSGVLRRESNDRLLRETRVPVQQTHTLSARHVEIRQADGFRQRFSISRAPELIALRSALLAVLDGDAELLATHFDCEVRREGARWQLLLRPLDLAVAERVQSLQLSGEGAEIDVLLMQLVDGETVRTELSPLQ